MKKSQILNRIFLLFFSAMTAYGLNAQNAYETLLDFKEKTIRLCLYEDFDPEIQIITVWDKNIINLVPDPLNPDNTVMKWVKCNKNQTYGGFAFGIRDVHIGLSLEGWKYFTYKIYAPFPVNTSILKFVKDGDIMIYHDTISIEAEPHQWYKAAHAIDESLYQEDNPIVIIIHPAGGEEVEGIILIDDIRLER